MRNTVAMGLVAVCAAFGAEYRVDCGEAKWKTLAAVNELELKAGDRVLLRGGCVWQGQLKLKGSGAEGRPIVVGRYGKGAMPRIEAGGLHEDAVLVKNQEWIEMRGLEVTNRGEGKGVRRGVHVWMENFGTARGVVIAGMYVHDVNGDNGKKDNGGIIWRTSGREKPTRFDGLRIEGNIVWKVDRSAIAAASGFWMRSRWFPSLRVVIRDNYVEDAGGDGIVPWASDGALVEHNVAKDCNKRADSYNAAIWPWSCDNTVVRLNEAMWTRTQKDGQGFDSDYNSKNTLIEWNYSHDNEGGFLLICTDGDGASGRHAGNTEVEVRYNISRNDHVRTFHLPGPVKAVKVHNNAVYTAAGETVNVVQFSNWKGWPDGVEFRDNEFVVGGTGRYGYEVGRTDDGNFKTAPGVGPSKNIRFEGNAYVGRHEGRPEDGRARESAPAKRVKWEGPVFDVRKPEGYASFVRAHRRWMERMMKAQFGKGPR